MEYMEMQEFLEQQNVTKDDMNTMWDYCVEHNHPRIAQLDRCGKHWSDLNKSALSTLKTQYDLLKNEEVV